MSILESTRKMTTNEKMCYDMGYAQGKQDAVPVVRCKECEYAKWYENGDFYCQEWGDRCDCPYIITGQSETDFCSYGAKMEDKPCG